MHRINLLFLGFSLFLLSSCGSNAGGRAIADSDKRDNYFLASPRNLSVENVSSASVTLTWDSVSNAVTYRLYHAREPITHIDNIHTLRAGNWIPNVSSPQTVTNLNNNTTYYFVVTAVLADTESDASNSVNATPLGAATEPQPTPEEVRMIELINRARLDPLAEVERHERVSDLNQGLEAGTISPTPKAPLAINQILMRAARNHSHWMLSTGNFSHTGEGGSSPNERIHALGYGPTIISGENISVRGHTQLNPIQVIDTHHSTLFESPDHRVNIFRETFRELGVGQELGYFTFDVGTFSSSMLTQNYATLGSAYFITGVVYDDINNNRIYDVGEGLANMVVTVNGVSHQAYDSGSYSVPVEGNATHRVTIYGNALPEPVEAEVEVTNRNIKLDVVLNGGAVEIVTW